MMNITMPMLFCILKISCYNELSDHSILHAHKKCDTLLKTVPKCIYTYYEFVFFIRVI